MKICSSTTTNKLRLFLYSAVDPSPLMWHVHN